MWTVRVHDHSSNGSIRAAAAAELITPTAWVRRVVSVTSGARRRRGLSPRCADANPDASALTQQAPTECTGFASTGIVCIRSTTPITLCRGGRQKVFARRRQLHRVFLLSVAFFGRHDERNRFGTSASICDPEEGLIVTHIKRLFSCSPLLPSLLPQINLALTRCVRARAGTSKAVVDLCRCHIDIAQVQ